GEAFGFPDGGRIVAHPDGGGEAVAETGAGEQAPAESRVGPRPRARVVAGHAGRKDTRRDLAPAVDEREALVAVDRRDECLTDGQAIERRDLAVEADVLRGERRAVQHAPGERRIAEHARELGRRDLAHVELARLELEPRELGGDPGET